MKFIAALLLALSMNAMAQSSGAGVVTLKPGESKGFHTGTGQYLVVSCQQSYNPNPNPYPPTPYPPYPGPNPNPYPPYPGPNPNPYPPGPNPNPGGSLSQYSNMPDDQLIYYAINYGVGACKIVDGRSCSSCACDYYVKAYDKGFPSGTGCQDYSSNAAKELRKAIQWGACN